MSQQINKYKCSKCGTIKETTARKGAKCRCGAIISSMWRKCPVCGVEKWMSYNAKQCKECYSGEQQTIMDVPVDMLHGKPERIQQLIKYNWWTQNGFARAVAECETVEQAESLYQDFLRGRAKAEFCGNSYANNFGNV